MWWKALVVIVVAAALALSAVELAASRSMNRGVPGAPDPALPTATEGTEVQPSASPALTR